MTFFTTAQTYMSNLAPLPYRIIALDLDGTLTNSQKIITPRTFEALMSAQREGVRLVLASGRPPFSSKSTAFSRVLWICAILQWRKNH